MTPTLTDLVFALPWILFAALGQVLIRRRPRLRDNPVLEGETPFVSVIVPARNEAENISGLTATLLSSEYRSFEVILVDDRSTDGTTEIAHRLAANHPDLIRVIEGKPLPAGWVGKCWACWQGYEAAKGDVLVFADADTRHHPRLLSHAVSALRTQNADLVTAFPRQLMFSFWERVVQPQVFVAIMMRYSDFQRINRTRNARDVIANGQFMVFSRESYEGIGGHAAVRTEVVEDLHLAKRTVATGRRLHVTYGEDLIATRMYRTLDQIIEGWSKNLAIASRQTVDPWIRPFLPWMIAAFIAGMWALPPLLLLASPVIRLVPVGWSATATAASLVFWAVTYRRFRIPVLMAPVYPLGALMTAVLFVRSVLRGENVTWRGRRYDAKAPPGDADGASTRA